MQDQNAALFQALCGAGEIPQALDVLPHLPVTHFCFLCLLKACNRNKVLIQTRQVYDHIIRYGFQVTGFLGDYLVLALARCGAAEDALFTSQSLQERTVFSWTAIINAYTEVGRPEQALKTYQSMLDDGVEPDKYTFVSLLKACGHAGDLLHGKRFHAEADSKGLTTDVYVRNTLVSMYGKCSAPDEASDVFCNLFVRDVVSWNAMLSAYVESGYPEEALVLYRQMQEERVKPNELTFVVSLHGCAILAESEQIVGRNNRIMDIGKAIQADAYRKGYQSDILLGNALVNVFGKCGYASEAENVFCALSHRDIVSWNSLISAYVQQGQVEKALQLYAHMLEENTAPQEMTYVICINACAKLAERDANQGKPAKLMLLEMCQALHTDFCRNGYSMNVVVGNALITLYGKCCALVEAKYTFDTLPDQDTISWTTMLSVYVEQGQIEKVLPLYRLMRNQEGCIDDVSLLRILQACVETGNVDLCRELHFDIVTSGYEETPTVASFLIHAYGNCASVTDAEVYFNGLAESDVVPWTVCISGYAGHGKSTASISTFENLKLVGIMPDEIAFTSVLLACSHSGLIIEGLKYFESMIRDYDIVPNTKHIGTVIDLLGRATQFSRIENLLEHMPVKADMIIWLCLLGVCQKLGNFELAKCAFRHAVQLDPDKAASYVLMSNVYANSRNDKTEVNYEEGVFLSYNEIPI